MNVQKLIAGVLLSAVLPGAAMAAQGSFAISGVAVNLIDLDTTDGVTPSITFHGERGGSGISVQYKPGNQYIWDYHDSFGTVNNSSQWAIVESGVGSKSLNLAAEMLDANASAESSAYFETNFTVSKNTLAIFSLPYTFSLTKSSNEFLENKFNFSASVPGSFFNTDYTFKRGQVSSTLFGEVNTGSNAAEGYFHMSASIFASGSGAPPVPEPGTYAMLLAGLGAIAWRLRQRNVTSA